MFGNGSKWLRADFHLHTKEDKEFKFDGEDYIKSYVDKLKEEEISIGVITNHNKFNWHEYKKLKKESKKRDILLLPGVELSVLDGTNGIHTLIAFKEDDWLTEGENFINKFLDVAFGNITNRENENVRCKMGLSEVISTLDKYEKDYFIVMAHIEGESGFYKSLGGGIIKQLSSEEQFKKSVHGFQKSKTYDVKKQLVEWMGYKVAYVEGSDPKCVEEIGRGKKGYLKLGDFSFESVKLSLKDFEFRVNESIPLCTHSHIEYIYCKGGKLNEQYIKLSSELNTLIGIRGSGKSSILELIRYALNINTDRGIADKEYKDNLIMNTLGSGGLVILKLIDSHGREYYVRRINGHDATVHNKDGEQLNISVKTIIRNPLYFGQKDLSTPGKEGFELNLLNKLLGDSLREIDTSISDKATTLLTKIREWKNIENIDAKIKQLEDEIEDKKHKMKIYEEKGVDIKLEKQSQYELDKGHLSTVIETLESNINKIKNKIDHENKSLIISLKKQDSKYNIDLFQTVNQNIDEFTATISKIDSEIAQLENIKNTVVGKDNQLEAIIKGLQAEFAEIKRDINEPNLDSDDYIKYSTTVESNKNKIIALTNDKAKKVALKDEIIKLSTELNYLLLEEFNLYKAEIEKINNSQDEIRVSIDFKGDKGVFISQLQNHLRGSNLNDANYKQLSRVFNDFVEIFNDIFLNDGIKLRPLITDKQYTTIKEKFNVGYNQYLKERPANKIEIMYHGKLLKNHSLGQRASALILFILTQKDNDLIMIDQPEDDLDNQVIYTELIKSIKTKKKDIQFVFATHNANIPVLGDAEKVIACEYGECIDIIDGSIDVKEVQGKIVDIMEGGPKAFKKRNQIYNMWTS